MASIPLQVQVPQIKSPIQSIGSLMQLKSGMANLAVQQAQVEQERENTEKLRAENEQKHRDLADSNFIQEALADPIKGPKIMAGDYQGLNIQPKTRQALETWHANHQKELMANTVTQNSLAAANLAKIEETIGGLKLLGDPNAIAEAYPQALSSLRAQKAFEYIPTENIPEAFNGDVKQLDKMLASVGGLRAATDKALATQTNQQKLDASKAQEERAAEQFSVEQPVRVAEGDTKKLIAEATAANPELITPDQQRQENQAAATAAATAENAQANRDVTIRGQDLSANTQRRGQDLADSRAHADGGGKPLPQPAIKSLETQANMANATKRLAETFKDGFAGNPVTGGLESFVARHGGESIGLADEGVGQWWQDYQTHKNDIRHGIFGAALTPGEKAEFDKQDIDPGMSPKQIRENLGRQAEIAKKALVRAGKVYAAGGYSPAQIKEFVPDEAGSAESIDPTLKAYADKYFGGDVEKAKAHNQKK